MREWRGDRSGRGDREWRRWRVKYKMAERKGKEKKGDEREERGGRMERGDRSESI